MMSYPFRASPEQLPIEVGGVAPCPFLTVKGLDTYVYMQVRTYGQSVRIGLFVRKLFLLGSNYSIFNAVRVIWF